MPPFYERWFFTGSSLEEEAIQHFQKHLALANNTTDFYQELNNVYYSIVGKDGNVVSLEQKMRDREEMLLKAKSVFAEKLGKPINNAFFLYWYYFYGQVPRVYKRVEGLEDIHKAVAILRGL